MVHTGAVRLKTSGRTDMHNITPQVEEIARESGVRSGVAVVFTPSSTSAITTIEFESGALEDLKQALERIAPSDGEYRHNLAWGDGNGYAHLRAALLGPSISVPIVDSHLSLGTWQQLLFIDFDNRSRQRELVVQIFGEKG